ncbi:DNA-directed RNA polymerase subunit alpha [Candidatus Giovannonibacteria bacterium RIFCSPHIGHO2_01_FULL_48_47]|nr:MAG: DNA-directed RNA polymerase subunit alpha [Candidatus Giovannonibacteria bacterium RIFCSPHIGHO2_01_FULL_48_47]OGF67875.1 MAG: DNA-directed RNA polymerase subunit alpha [Candidatus Giovannonibacteria bacterium RIFCSPHIGHO2_02_FULL_48_15]OGF88139.1 MAG: DNA-directed RNA polymerase subunit alpha [Candidatus Giovannonibacteria bacterium RIFCSPLOWO2_01_FULL_48_47]OGF94927.1 MAG: DNA-directed RNA polymerase subunit alpha [Candidatus Giovannonibacteria bacterium RIFOXYC1_FULL_48_8]OGF95998.1 M
MIYTISLPSRIRAVLEEGDKGVYEVDALHPGYGHTLGNSLRRVLLSSLPGTAITRVKIQGVSHEFSTIPDVKEDVISILLNLKRLRLLMHTDEPQVIKLSAHGVKKVKAEDFEVPTQVEVISKDLPVATLTSKEAKLELEATVERGLGYVPREVLEQEKVEVGTLTLDAIFTPIRKVNYEVENMRVGDRTDYNRLRFSIETDGTITPRQALEESLSILMKQLQALSFSEPEVFPKVEAGAGALAPERVSEELPIEAEGEDAETPLKIRVEDLELSARTQNALTTAGIRTVGGLVKKSKGDLLELSGVGAKAVAEIEKALADLNLSLKE